jgi:hypothetical protein
MLDIVLALDSIANGLKPLEVDELLQSVSFGKAVDESGPVFEDPADEIVGHADIEDAVRTIG